ncbi:hypothetical protein SAMN04488128_103776 [Chitinophaga eiseniae]|uniref:Uncharacterized protein n=1 Tax=Chitinophaga eiseniae TaxID=634771 RepID=A0A1T4SY16_9BACT|nr:hypothetical protein [Chitinophaga eiseniae]SKA33144.1 hypothetical protein SAMN04488128_103776 [Chitinophaga eiseniae]
MKAKLLSLVKSSISEGYLPKDWHCHKKNVVETFTGYLSLIDGCVAIGTVYYHKIKDGSHFVADIEGGFILKGDSIKVNMAHDEFIYTHEDNAHIYLRYLNEYYTDESLTAFNLVIMADGTIAHIDHAYYWESDQEYHYDPEDDDNDEPDDDDVIWDYHDGPMYHDCRADDRKPGIGFEIEKAGDPEFCGHYNKEQLFRHTGCIMESDATVDWELKTPVYPLFSEKIESSWLPEIARAINAKNHNNAGGHIHLSLPPKSGKQMFDHCRPYMPLFMALYPKRLEKDYCIGKKEHNLKQDGDKHQAIKIWPDRIELRFPAKVYNLKALLFRLRLCRLMVAREHTNILSVTLAAFDKKEPLYQLLMEEYTGRELMLLQRIIKTAKDYFNTELQNEKSIEALLKNLKCNKACVLPS